VKSIAIVQSNYIPWKGYFDLIAAVDEFVLYDDMQYTRRDWRNRNRIKTSGGLQWLTIPVQVKGQYEAPIRSIQVDGNQWAVKHWKSLEQHYKRASHFDEVADWLAPLYLNQSLNYLSEINRLFLTSVCQYLGIETAITNSWDYAATAGKSERLASICEQAGASSYLSGPAARGYLDEGLFEDKGIHVRWFDYSNYPEYPQLWGDFEHSVSIVDLLFNCGPSARDFLKVGAR